MKDIILYTLAVFGAVFLVLFLLFGITDSIIERNLSCDELVKRNPSMTVRQMPARCFSYYQQNTI